ncbi:lysophospholipid acyltransferase family protein [Candidatus Uabimicrobium sp. HlEnr_7]|uniref:lysophospholipid acyltransferase family protein n=1 Tax=Candidatus Uabimicrobium helgolandensis TaxID=3095367 RepID=UPI0035584C1E
MTKKRFSKRITKKIGRYLRRFGIFIGKYTIPFIYNSYCWFVWITSKTKDGTEDIEEFFHKQNKPVTYIGLLWHQDVFLVAHAYRRFNGYTLASRGHAGDIIARMLTTNNFKVFRGGSSKGKKRRKKVLDELVDHLAKQDKFAIGITVDGSSGPIYRMKTGMIVAAMKLQAPIFCVRIWCKRKFLLPTWDRTMIPLPFNNIEIFVQGPYYAPPEMNEQEFNEFHKKVENGLLDVTYLGYQHYEKEVTSDLLAGFPEDWKPKE